MKHAQKLVLVVCNVRSAHNVGSLLRTADGFGVDRVYLCGITPYPQKLDDNRMPHVRARVDARISKTALGAQNSQKWQYEPDCLQVLRKLKRVGYFRLGLEQTDSSVELTEINPRGKTALVVGNEVEGLDDQILSLCDASAHIAMHGKKESFNVAVAAGVGLFYLSR